MDWLGNAAVSQIDAPKVRLASKHGWLPVLVVLFLVSYGLMTMLIVEQGATIETQRTLIRDLFRDSSELSAVKEKAVQDKNAADAKRRGQAQAPSAPSHSDQASSDPSSNQNKSNQAGPRHAAKKPQLAAPSRPAADLADARRSLVTI